MATSSSYHLKFDTLRSTNTTELLAVSVSSSISNYYGHRSPPKTLISRQSSTNLKLRFSNPYKGRCYLRILTRTHVASADANQIDDEETVKVIVGLKLLLFVVMNWYIEAG